MTIFSWIRRKLNAKQETRKPYPVSANNHILPEPSKEEFNDWPHGLLTIGTFGIKEEPQRCNLQGSEASCHDHLLYITPEEVGELQKELKLILDKHNVESSSTNELETHNFHLETIFNSSSVDRTASYTLSDEMVNKDGPLQHSNSAVLSGGKGGHLDSNNNAIGKKSLSFLLKKMFLSRIEFALTPSLRDSLQESRLEKSRMKKMFRAILNKKLFPQNSSPKAPTAKIYLQNKKYCMTDSDDEMFEAANGGSKWVKTDSECNHCSRDIVCPIFSQLKTSQAIRMGTLLNFLVFDVQTPDS